MVCPENVASTFELLIIDENRNISGDSNWNTVTGVPTQLQQSEDAIQQHLNHDISDLVPLEGL